MRRLDENVGGIWQDFDTIVLSIDFETYSQCDLREAGAYVYARHPSTELLIISYTCDEALSILSWRYGDIPPANLFQMIEDASHIRAFSADFEREIYEHVCVKKMGWPPIPIEKWLDTQALTYSLALPGALGWVAEALETAAQKNIAGSRLIRKFSIPHEPTKNNPSTRTMPDDDPQDFALFMRYCEDDVRTECAVYNAIPLKFLSETEQQIYNQHVRMNREGLLLDAQSAASIRAMLGDYHVRYTKELHVLTDGYLSTHGQRDRFLEWATMQGYKLEGFTKFDLNLALLDETLPAKVRRAIEIRLILSQVSTKKFIKMERVMGLDNRCRGNMVYHRASTGRSGGAGLQLHNFPRDYISRVPEVIEQCLDFIERREYTAVELLYGQPFDVAKGLLRPMIIAPPGHLLYVSDFSGVENRGVAWVANDLVGLKVFAEGRDQYREFAAAQFKITAAQVSDERRTAAKATILGAIFGAGWKTIYATNVQRGIPMTETEAETNVNDFRRIYHETTKTWYALETAATSAVSKRVDVVYKGLKFGVRGNFLFIKLHSGRLLAYSNPKYELVKLPWGEMKYGVTYKGLSARKQWIRMNLTPSRLIENIVSGICRDLLMHSALVIERDGRANPILTVHDEVVSYARPEDISISEYNGLMSTVPEWAVNHAGVRFPVVAEGYTSRRYKK